MAAERVTINRELWAAAVNALDSDDPGVRRSALHRMLAAVPASWDVDLDEPPDGWQETRPTLRPDTGLPR